MAQNFQPKAVSTPQNPAQAAAVQETAAPHVRHFRTILFQGYLIASLSVFAILAVLASTTAYFQIDLTITKTLQTLSAPWFRGLMEFVSWLGYMPTAPIITLLFAVVLLLFGFQWESLSTIVSVVGIGALNTAVKAIVSRPRPAATLVEVYQNLTSYSFPSGHVMFFMALFGFLLFLAFVLLKRSVKRTILVILFLALIILVGVSRIYLGEHWASDVLAAYLLSGLGLALVTVFYRWGKARFFAKQPVAPDPTAQAVAGVVPVTAADGVKHMDDKKNT